MEQQFNNQFSNQSTSQQPKLKTVKPFLVVILLVLIVVLVGVLLWQKNTANQATNALQKQVVALQNQALQKNNQSVVSQSNNQINNTIIATTSNEVAGWKTYTNTEYGYEVKYPSDWVYDELTTPTKGEIVSFSKDKNGVGEVQIYSMPNSKGDKSLKDWWYNNEYKRLGEPSTFFSGIIQHDDGGALSVYWKDNNDSKYAYRATMGFLSSLNHVETFQRLSFYYQMLSTFKFTK